MTARTKSIACSFGVVSVGALVLLFSAVADARFGVNHLIGFGANRAGGIGGNDANTVLLLHCDGPNTSQTFTDSSSGGTDSPRMFTARGNAQIDTSESQLGGASCLFDGTGDSFDTADSSDFQYGTGDFTIDVWIRPASISLLLSHTIIAQIDDSVGPNIQWGLTLFAGGTLKFTSNVTDITVNGNSVLSTGVWYHVAVQRDGNNFTIFLDGVSDGTATSSAIIDHPAGKLVEVGGNAGVLYFDGWIDELRVSNVARYSGNFTPPTVPYD